MATQTATQSLQSFIDRFNQAWQDKAFEEVSGTMDPQVVFVTPSGKEIKGKDACTATFQEFMTYTQLQSFKSEPADIHQWASTATIRYVYRIQYKVEDELFDESGIDLWVLELQGSEWKIVWRALLPV